MIEQIIKNLRKAYPPSFFDRAESPFYVLISTVLSQRTRDETTYKIAPKLFKKYRTPQQFMKADSNNIKKIIKGIGFYNQKTKRIKEISKILVEKYSGKVPKTFEELISLPGVGRKTANCVLVYAFRIPAIPTDIHVHRLSNRIGWVKTKTPEETEAKLIKIIRRKYWIEVNELLVKHGQSICKPITPICSKCPITKYCAYFKNKKNKRK